jgi:GNAT superfamily N-acetyltransferase
VARPRRDDAHGPGRPSEGCALRAGNAKDGTALARVFGAARSEMRYLPTLHSHEDHVAYFSGVVLPASQVTVATIDGEVVGFSAVKEGWLDHLYVIPAEQGHGTGGALLDVAMRQNPGGLMLWAFIANHRAIALYGRAGFVEVLRTEGRGSEEQVPDVQMRWAGSGPA